MMTDVVDELMTPGCPQCAVKHLSAALYHVAKARGWDVAPDMYMVDVCTAYINLVEVRAGYRSHLWYAVGALARAEERVAGRIGHCVARDARIALEFGGEGSVPDALRILDEGVAPNHADWAAAHFDEARRELPAMAGQMSMDDLLGSIEKVRKEFFELPPSTVPGEGETTQTGKEPAMATAKKTASAKKAGCKGGKCCDKGGKAKKACDKGGKAKK